MLGRSCRARPPAKADSRRANGSGSAVAVSAQAGGAPCTGPVRAASWVALCPKKSSFELAPEGGPDAAPDTAPVAASDTGPNTAPEREPDPRPDLEPSCEPANEATSPAECAEIPASGHGPPFISLCAPGVASVTGKSGCATVPPTSGSIPANRLDSSFRGARHSVVTRRAGRMGAAGGGAIASGRGGLANVNSPRRGGTGIAFARPAAIRRRRAMRRRGNSPVGFDAVRVNGRTGTAGRASPVRPPMGKGIRAGPLVRRREMVRRVALRRAGLSGNNSSGSTRINVGAAIPNAPGRVPSGRRGKIRSLAGGVAGVSLRASRPGTWALAVVLSSFFGSAAAGAACGRRPNWLASSRRDRACRSCSSWKERRCSGEQNSLSVSFRRMGNRLPQCWQRISPEYASYTSILRALRQAYQTAKPLPRRELGEVAP